ncbi:MAG: Maf family nucleotide pyrophosphatase [Bacteroidales bacterium]|nr:Maf family nucleotide pyrophosphatase [Bacteroidales bacterium]
MLKNYKLILASKSPRRKELLAGMGFEFEIRTKPVQENFPGELTKEQVAVYLCEKKAKAFSEDEISANEIIITADTIVCLNDQILNKPGDHIHAIEMLTALSGKMHEVITGVCLRRKSTMHSFFVSTNVFFKNLSTLEIEFYVNHYRPFDKAGAYGIQEWIGYIGIEKIEGSYFNVVGLPTARLNEELSKLMDGDN